MASKGKYTLRYVVVFHNIPPHLRVKGVKCLVEE